MVQVPTLSGLYTRILSLEAHQPKLVDTPTIDVLVTNLTTKFNSLSTQEGSQRSTLKLLSDAFSDLKDLYVTHEAAFLSHTGDSAAHHSVGAAEGLGSGEFTLHTGFSHHHTQPDILTKGQLDAHTGDRGGHHTPYWAGWLREDQVLSGTFSRLRHEQITISHDEDFGPKIDSEVEFLVAGTYYISSIANFAHAEVGGAPDIVIGKYWAEAGFDLGVSHIITGSEAYTWMSGGSDNNATIDCIHTFAIGEQLKIKAVAIAGGVDKKMRITSGACSFFVYRLGP